MPKQIFTIEIDHDEDAHFIPDDLRLLINDIVVHNLPDAGSRPLTVNVEIGTPVPKVLVSVSGGIAEVVAADRDVEVILVDYDNDIDDEDDVDTALSPDIEEGDVEKFDNAVEAARQELSKHLEDDDDESYSR